MLRNCSVIPFEATNGFHFSICTPTDTHYFLMTSEEERRFGFFLIILIVLIVLVVLIVLIVFVFVFCFVVAFCLYFTLHPQGMD